MNVALRELLVCGLRSPQLFVCSSSVSLGFFVLFFKVTFEARKQVTKHKFKTIMLFLAA